MKATARSTRCNSWRPSLQQSCSRLHFCTSHSLWRRPAAAARLAAAPEVSSASPRNSPAQGPAARPLTATEGPRVLHIDRDAGTAKTLAALLTPEAHVTHVRTLAEARRMLARQIFSLVVIDPSLPDGDGASLLPALVTTPVLVYALSQPEWHTPMRAFLPKPWTSHRQLWTTISGLLGIPASMSAGD